MRSSVKPSTAAGSHAVPTFPRCHVPAATLLALLLAVNGYAFVADTPDAVIELWEQHWTLNADGSTVYHEKQHVRLNNERAFGEFADPRLTYTEGADQIEILAARTKSPSGSYTELPEYGQVQVAPNASAGWPAFAGLRQHLVVLSGIEPGCLVEIEYKITSSPGARLFLAGDVRLDHHYPVKERKVTITVPANVPLKTATSNLPPSQSATRPNEIVLHDLPAVIDEPQAAPWQTRCARLMFTTVGKTSDWLKLRQGQIERAADSSDLVKKLAAEWTKDVQDPASKLRALQEKLAATFNFVEFPLGWRPAQPRPASDVLQCNYGLPLEAAAALLALARAADLTVLPGILVDDHLWNHEVPQDSMVAAYVVLLNPSEPRTSVSGFRPSEPRTSVSGFRPKQGGAAPAAPADTGDYPELWDPQRGRVVRDAHWAGCTLLPVPDVLLPRTRLPGWTDAEESRCSVTGKITLADDGNFAGTLTLRTTGFFASSESLRTSDAQKARLAALLARVIPDLNIDSFAVKTLAPGEFEAAAQVKSAKPLKKLGDRFLLQLAQDGPLLADVPLPLAYHERKTPVHLTGPCNEDLDVTIEWPEKWSLETRPNELPAVTGPWGSVSQTVAIDKKSLKLRRATRLAQADLSAADFLLLRGPLNDLRSEVARTVTLLKP